MLMVKIGSWTRDLCLGDPISLPLHHEVTPLKYLGKPKRIFLKASSSILYTQTWLLSPWLVSTRYFENLFSVTISKFLPCLVSTKKFVYKRIARLAWKGGDICGRESYENKHCQIPPVCIFHSVTRDRSLYRPPSLWSTLVIVSGFVDYNQVRVYCNALKLFKKLHQ
jgi:hypothetical protein